MSLGILICLVLWIAFGAAIPWAVRNDNLAALENLDDEQLAGMIADEWNQEVKA